MPYATAPSKSGYEFGGYYTSRNGIGTQYYTASMSSARTWNKSSNTTLYAYWIEDNKVSLTASNFEDYFTVTTSGSLSGYSATISYSIKPKNSSYAYDDNSSSSITVKIKVSFYTSQYSSYPVKTDYINVTLYKSSGFKKSGSESIYLGSNYDTIYWGTDISSCSGTIGK